MDKVRALFTIRSSPAHSQVTSPYSYISNKSQYYYLHCADGETEVRRNIFTTGWLQSHKHLQPRCDAWDTRSALYHLNFFAISACFFSEKKTSVKYHWAELSPLRDILQDLSCRVHLALSVNLSVTDCCCADLPSPHPTVTWPHQAVSEIDSFPPSRDVRGTKTMHKKLCKPAGKHCSERRLLQEGRSRAGVQRSCRGSAQGWWDAPQRAELPPHVNTGFKVFYQKAQGWGCFTAVLLQRDWSNTTGLSRNSLDWSEVYRLLWHWQ